MTERVGSWLRSEPGAIRGALWIGCGAGCIGLLALLLGSLAAREPAYGLGAALLILLVGLAAADLTLLPVLAIPATMIVYRVGGGTGLSVSDFVLFVALLCALLSARFGRDDNLRSMMWVFAAYLATVVPTLVFNPYRANILEWFHEVVLLAGSLVVGWVVGRANRLRAATGLYVLLSCALAVWTCGAAITNGFQPVNLQYGMQKNFIGDMLAFAVLMCYARPVWFGWRGGWMHWANPLLLLGIIASQSRQAMISLAVGGVVVLARSKYFGKRSKLVLLALVPLVVFAAIVFKQQLDSTNRFNSTHQRLTWFGDSIDIWHTSPWFGVGLRWWYSGRFIDAFQPPNAIFEMLTSAGVLGVVGILALFFGSLYVLWRLPPVYGTIAFVAVLMRIVQGQLDLFWVGAQGSIPWLIVGAALGAMARENGIGSVANSSALEVFRADAADSADDTHPAVTGDGYLPSRIIRA